MDLGITSGITADAYHAGPGVSRSQLWTLYCKSPAHLVGGEKEDTQALVFGRAVDDALLMPETFEKTYVRGPEDRRGGRWTNAQANATNTGQTLLTEGDYDACRVIRDAVHANSYLNRIIVSSHSQTGTSAYWIDAISGELCKARADLLRRDIGLILDLKTAREADPKHFANAVANYGYHVQEAYYSDGYNYASAKLDIGGFVFLAIEKEPPYAFGVYELMPGAVAEGRAIYRKALDTYAKCKRENYWPGYPEEVTPLDLPRWAYRETSPIVEEVQ